MSKSGILVLIIAAVVFCGLGFVAGNIVSSAGSTPGTKDDPVATRGYVDNVVGTRASDLQDQIDQLKALVEGDNTKPSDSTTTPSTPDDTTVSNVKVTADSVNVRAAATTSAAVVGTVNKDTVLSYISSTTASDGVWYKVKLSNGSEGYIASWLCGTPY